MFKKFAAIACVGLMTFAFTGCEAPAPAPTTEETPAAEATPAEAAPSAEATSEEAAPAEGESN